MTYVIQWIPKKDLPLDRGKIELPGTVENHPPIPLVGERARDRQGASHPGKEGDRLFTALLVGRRRNVLRHSPDVRSQRLQECPACAARPTGHFSCASRQPTTA